MRSAGSRVAAGHRGTAGFTLFEALVSVALMGLIVACLSAVTGQWLPNWHRGYGRVQRLEALDVGLQRLVADLEAAEYVTTNGETKFPLFIGETSSVTLVRVAVGLDVTPHLEVVNFGETKDDRGLVLVRSRAAFKPLVSGTPPAGQLHFADPVVLIRAPFRVAFAFAGPDRVWQNTWRDAVQLPIAVRVQVFDMADQHLSSVSTASLLHVEVPAACAGSKSVNQCLAGATAPTEQPSPGTTGGGDPAPAAAK